MSVSPVMTVMVAYDGSTDSRRAVKYAGRFFPHAAPRVNTVVVTAWESNLHQAARVSAMSGVVGPTRADSRFLSAEDTHHAEAQRVNAEGIELARAAGLTAEGRLVAIESTVWAALVAAAEELSADVIVTGSRGATGLKALLHSSVSEHIMRHCRRPVMIVPSGCAELVDEAAAS
jgi:nucleotide-binding universal stress UspA family protein